MTFPDKLKQIGERLEQGELLSKTDARLLYEAVGKMQTALEFVAEKAWSDDDGMFVLDVYKKSRSALADLDRLVGSETR